MVSSIELCDRNISHLGPRTSSLFIHVEQVHFSTLASQFVQQTRATQLFVFNSTITLSLKPGTALPSRLIINSLYRLQEPSSFKLTFPPHTRPDWGPIKTLQESNSDFRLQGIRVAGGNLTVPPHTCPGWGLIKTLQQNNLMFRLQRTRVAGGYLTVPPHTSSLGTDINKNNGSTIPISRRSCSCAAF